ncbi:MAG: hypothetical protein PHD54_03860 [Desulfuromonadaceae bacterium]|nr:hypothetical protein [Desulfuromonadaceae bacterium]
MSSVLSFYLDGTVVQVLRADISKHVVVTVNDALTFPDKELGAYLATCQIKTCILCFNPTLFFQDTLNLPPAASRFYGNLIHAEVQKRHPDIETFSFFYRSTGETTIDGVAFNRIAVFSYKDDSLSEYISLFSNHGKMISNIYAAPYPVFRLAAAACLDDLNTPRLVIASIPNEKMITLSMNGEPAFIRRIPSADVELQAADTDNINMTIDYCFQSLRVRPAEALLLNLRESLTEPAQQISTPLRQASLPALAALPPELADNYIAPLAAAMHYAATPSLCDITPAEYVTFKRGKRYLTVAIIAMILFSILLGGLNIMERLVISDMKSAMVVMRGQLAKAAEELATYRKLDDEVKRLGRPIEELNKLSTSISPASALATLSPFNTSLCTLRQLSTKKGEGYIEVQMEGDLNSDSYGDTQTIYEEALARLIRIPGYSISSSSVDIHKKTFIIKARFKNSAGQSK